MSIDYFGRYFTKDGFDFTNLINDDFLVPIRLLYQNQHYVSAAKLFMIFIDSIGYIEYGETSKNPFIDWVNAYADLSAVGISADQLWEHRNSLLHMSNLDSRKVVSGKIKRLMFYVGTLPKGMPSEGPDAIYYNFTTLILTIAKGCEKWLNTYDTDRNKIDSFVKRYDLITSDNRMFRVNFDQTKC